MGDVAYMDSSAIVKTIIAEPESAALRRVLRRYAVHAACALARTETMRAVRRSDSMAVQRAQDAMARLLVIEMTSALLTEAGRLDPVELRTLDAIHLASAMSLGTDLAVILTYDERMAAAAVSLGLPCSRPA